MTVQDICDVYRIIIIIIDIMFMKVQACFLFLDLQEEVGPSISSSVVLCSFVILVILQCLFWQSIYVHPLYVLQPFFLVLFYFLYYVLCSRFPNTFFSSSSFVIPSTCLKNFICAVYKRCSSLLFSTQASLPNFNAALAVIL